MATFVRATLYLATTAAGFGLGYLIGWSAGFDHLLNYLLYHTRLI